MRLLLPAPSKTALGLPRDKLVHAFINNMKLDGMGGFRYQAHHLFHPVIGDMSFREWGAVMADYMNAKLKVQKYSYVDFAWTGLEEFSSPFQKAKPLNERLRE